MKYSYTDSGVEWLGRMPEHWGTTKLKNHFWVMPSNVDKKTNEGEAEVKLCNYVDVYYNEKITAEIDFMVASANEREIAKFSLRIDDILITKDSEDPHDIAVPAIVKHVEKGLLCGYHLSMLRRKSRHYNSDFLFWALKDEAIASQLYREACGVTRWAIASRHIKNSVLPLPPPEEQAAIAAYLDHACAKLDRVIAIKEEQLGRLEEVEKDKISSLLIGVADLHRGHETYPWLPTMARGWKVVPMKRLLSEKLKYGANEAAEQEVQEHPRYIRITDFGYDGQLRSETFKSLPPDVAAPYMLEQGDVLFARSGATVGKTFLFAEENLEACYAGYLIRARTAKHIMRPEYLYYYTMTKWYERWKDLIFTQATIQNIGADKYQYLPVVVPPTVKDQDRLIAKVKLVLSANRGLKTRISEQVTTLKTYRKSLIHECVTGKKQVYTGSSKKQAAVA